MNPLKVCVVLGVMCSTAVLTGALLVGDSMRGSLRDLTLQRLGNIDTILFAPNFISTPALNTDACGVIYMQAAVEYNGKVCGTQILAKPFLTQTACNAALSEKLGCQAGDEIRLRLLSPSSIPPESAFGQKDNVVRTTVTVDELIPNKGPGRFSLKNDQQTEPLLLVPLKSLQRKLETGDKVNAVFFYSAEEKKCFLPSPPDLGIRINGKYITSERMLFTDKQVDALLAAGLNPHSFGLLYLATSIKAKKNGREVPYSTVFAAGRTTCAETERPAASDSITLNQWTAADLQVQPGDEIELTWFAPDNAHIIQSKIFTLTKIIPNDFYTNDVVPAVKGFTDEQSIADWKPPFPFDAKKIRKIDEEYWDTYKAAPKAVVDLETGQNLWGSRFGKVSVLMNEQETFLPAIHSDDYPVFGLNDVPVKELGLQAAQGTTPFSVLFLCFSFFIIASALLLIALLFRLSMELKAKEIGIRLACGWTPQQVFRLLLTDGLILAAAGSFFGVPVGIGYAALMIFCLTTYWVDAITVPFITLHITPLSLWIGFFGGILLAFLSMFFTIRKLIRFPIIELLHNKIQVKTYSTKHKISINSPFSFALSNAQRNPTRSLLCVFLIASAVYLVLTVSVFRIEHTENGTDGIDYLAETAFPIYEDISTPQGRSELGLQQQDEKLFEGITIYPFRMKDGDSTSCLNLYQTGNPRVLGMPDSFQVCKLQHKKNDLVPIVLDQNTAMYALHLYGGIGETYTLPNTDIRCEVAGLLNNSFLQGEILMREENFLQTFPDVSGWKYFLISCGKKKCEKQLYDLLGDYGVQMEKTTDRLSRLSAVQNTYLSAFQSLGGIGLLLGTFGLAVIQIRNIFERRKELALFYAVGFRPGKIIALLLYENFVLLFGGLLIAVFFSLLSLIAVAVCVPAQPIMFFRFMTAGGQLCFLLLLAGVVSNVAAALYCFNKFKNSAAGELAEER